MLMTNCQSKSIDLNGYWTPINLPIYQGIIISNDTIFLSTSKAIESYTFIKEGNRIWLNDSVDFLSGQYFNRYRDTLAIRTIITILHSDTLELTNPKYKGMKFRFLKQKNELVRYDINTVLIVSNGWNTEYSCILSVDGKYKIQIKDYWKETTKLSDGILTKHFRTIIANNLSLAFERKLNPDYKTGCCDCPTYMLRLERNDTIKSYYVSDDMDELSFSIYPIIGLFKRAQYKTFNKIIDFDSTDFIQKDTTFIMRKMD